MTDHDTELAKKLTDKAIQRGEIRSPYRMTNLNIAIAIALRSVRREENEKHEALIGVLVGVAQQIAETKCSVCAKKHIARKALAHPLVQEYLKKEKV